VAHEQPKDQGTAPAEGAHALARAAEEGAAPVTDETKLGPVIRESERAYLVRVERQGHAAFDQWVPKDLASTTREGIPPRTFVWVPVWWARSKGIDA
jgi:hypothetical protein